MVHDRNYKAEDTELLVRHYVPGAEVAHSHGMEVCFSLPLSQVDKFTGESAVLAYLILSLDLHFSHSNISKDN